MFVIYAKIAVSVFLYIFFLWVIRIKKIHTFKRKTFDILAIASCASSRLIFFLLIYKVGEKIPAGDVVLFYLPQASQVLNGALPAIDFPTSYGPFFPGIAAIIFYIAKSPFGFHITNIIIEAFSLFLWLRIGRYHLKESNLRKATLLYLASSRLIFNVAINTQNQIWISCLLACSIYFLIKNKITLSSLSLSFSILCVKFLPILFAPILAIASSRLWLWSTVFITPLIIIYGLITILGGNIFSSFLIESQLLTPGNIGSLFRLMGIQLTLQQLDLLLLTSISIATVLYISKYRFQIQFSHIIPLICIVLLLILTFGKKSWTQYLTIVMFPLCMIIAKERLTQGKILIFFIFNALTVIHHHLFYLPTSSLNTCIQFSADLLIISAYTYLIGLSTKSILSQS